MFFKKTRCPDCDSLYDEMLDYCPICGMRNNENQNFKHTHPLTFIPWYRELMLFLFGWAGLTILSLIYSIIFNFTYKIDNNLGSLLINTSSYVTLFIVLLIVIFPYFISIVERFKLPLAYMWAGIGVAALVGFSYAYGVITSVLIPDLGEGGNQSAVSSMVINYPLISIVIIGIIGPIVEELTYRVGLFTLLRRVHPSIAYIGTALIFGLIHFDFFSSDYITELVLLVNYVFAGLTFSFIYEKGGFAASTLAHISNNLFSVIMIIIAQYIV